MFPQLRRPRTLFRTDRAAIEIRVRSRGTALEDFWNAMADDTEALSNEELRAELAQFRLRGPKDVH